MPDRVAGRTETLATVTPLTTDDLGSAAQRERRRRILDATVALASQGGFDAVQMRAVAEHADVALGTLYRYFPSKIHLLVSALSRQLEETTTVLGRRTIRGETPAERVNVVLGRATRSLQEDPHLAEALTRAFMFADSTVAGEIRVVGMQVVTMIHRAMQGADHVEGEQPTEHDVTVARVISDVWLATLVAWVTGRLSAEEVADHLATAVDLVLR
jgi:AcrR family transcriptional regulator